MMTDTHEVKGWCANRLCVSNIAMVLECGCVQLLNMQCMLEKGVCIYTVMHPLCKAISLCVRGRGREV